MDRLEISFPHTTDVSVANLVIKNLTKALIGTKTVTRLRWNHVHFGVFFVYFVVICLHVGLFVVRRLEIIFFTIVFTVYTVCILAYLFVLFNFKKNVKNHSKNDDYQVN